MVKKINAFRVEVPIALGNDFRIAKQILNDMIENKDFLNIEEKCNTYVKNGYTNVFPFNNRILLIDYAPYFNSNFKRSFKFQFMYSNTTLYGYCSG